MQYKIETISDNTLDRINCLIMKDDFNMKTLAK